MPIRPGIREHFEAATSKYEREVRAELFAAARRPVESLTTEHVNWLIEMMEYQNRVTHAPIYFFNL